MSETSKPCGNTPADASTAAGPAPVWPTDLPPADPWAATAVDTDEATVALAALEEAAGNGEPAASPVAVVAPSGSDDEPTGRLKPRWTGTARVPAPGGRLRERREHTLELPIEERAALDRLPVTCPEPAAPPVTVPDAPPPTALPRPPAGLRPAYHPPTQRARRRSRSPAAGTPVLAGRPASAPTPAPGPPPGWAPPGSTPPRWAPPRWSPAPPGRTAPPGPAAPARRTPQPRWAPAPPRRRRRRWPWVMFTFTLLTIACCGGCVGWLRPFVVEYPATVAIETDVPGLSRTNDAARQRTAGDLLPLIQSQQVDEQSFRVVYADRQQRSVILFGTTRFVGDPRADLEAGITRLTERLRLTGLRAVQPGPLGGHQRCGSGTLSGRTVTMCAWADHGTLAVGLFGGRTVDQAADLLRTIREAIVRRG